MKIRDKLFVAFSLYLIITASFGFFAYKGLRTITTRFLLVETADDITNNLLEVRRYEKNFLLYKDPLNLLDLKKYLGALKDNIDNIRSEIIGEIGEDNYDMMKQSIADYERLVNVIADNVASQFEMAPIVMRKGRVSERLMAGAELQAFLALRKYEKNIMLYKTEETYRVFTDAMNASSFKNNAEIRNYSTLVAKLFHLYNEERASVEAMRHAGRKIQSFTESLSRRERIDITTILKMSMNLLLAALVTMVFAGLIINAKLAANIATPLRRLEKISKKIASGDFSERIEVKGKDEMASLEAAFNHMEEKLQNALWSLEHAVEKLREKQAQLVEAEKLAAVGKLAAGIAHEINNPLTSVLTFSNLMLEQCPEGDPHCDKLRMMARETERARNIVRQLLNFGRETSIKPVKLSVNEPVREIIDSLIAQEAFTDIELSVSLSERLPDVHADPAQIGQVVLNMLLNAIHAITPPGRIEVATRANEHGVEMVFTDTGAGIPPENINKIFDPFFTTKEGTKGTGLGLAVSYGIIKKHGGDIEVKSATGKGTTFTVRLPIYG